MELVSRCLEGTYSFPTEGGARAKALVRNAPDCAGNTKEGGWLDGGGGAVGGVARVGTGGRGPELEQ